MLHGHLRRVFHLIQVLPIQFCQCRSGHGTGGADLGLTAAFRTGNGGVCLGQIADNTGGGKGTADLFVGKALGVLGVFENGGQYPAGPAGGGGDHCAVVGVLLCHGVGVGGDVLEFF